MACAFVPQIAIFGENETPIFGADEIPSFGDLPPCSLTLRDQFAMSALIALGADQTYNFSRQDRNREQSTVDAYVIADFMLEARKQ